MCPPHGGSMCPPHGGSMCPPHGGSVCPPHGGSMRPPHGGSMCPPHHCSQRLPLSLVSGFESRAALGGCEADTVSVYPSLCLSESLSIRVSVCPNRLSESALGGWGQRCRAGDGEPWAHRRAVSEKTDSVDGASRAGWIDGRWTDRGSPSILPLPCTASIRGCLSAGFRGLDGQSQTVYD
jgi:hypothetical protein